MSTAVEESVMTPRELAEFYTPLVKEYADKLGALCEQANDLKHRSRASHSVELFQIEAARLIELFECLRPILEQLIRRSATILDLADIGRDYELALALRQEELEAQHRFAPLAFAELESQLGAKQVRAIIEKTRVNAVR